jgi:hypothetical protein
MSKSNKNALGLLVILAVVAGALFYLFQPQFGQPTIELTNDFESNGFRFSYPEGWQHQIPQTNMLFLGSPEVLAQQVGASITVQRSIRLSGETDTLEAALAFYLERGPLRADRAWTVIGDVENITFAERDALLVSLEGAEIAATTPMHSDIYITRANNGLIYIFTATAPQEQWQAIQPKVTAILDSVTILE